MKSNFLRRKIPGENAVCQRDHTAINAQRPSPSPPLSSSPEYAAFSEKTQLVSVTTLPPTYGAPPFVPKPFLKSK
jgi:hypothetical protein